MKGIAAVVAACVLGAITAVAAVAVHQQWPWLLAALGAALLVIWWFGRRATRTAWALAWGAVVLRASVPRAEGDFLVAADAQGWTLLLGSLSILLVALVLPDRTPPRLSPMPGSHPTHT